MIAVTFSIDRPKLEGYHFPNMHPYGLVCFGCPGLRHSDANVGMFPVLMFDTEDMIQAAMDDFRVNNWPDCVMVKVYSWKPHDKQVHADVCYPDLGSDRRQFILNDVLDRGEQLATRAIHYLGGKRDGEPGN